MRIINQQQKDENERLKEKFEQYQKQEDDHKDMFKIIQILLDKYQHLNFKIENMPLQSKNKSNKNQHLNIEFQLIKILGFGALSETYYRSSSRSILIQINLKSIVHYRKYFINNFYNFFSIYKYIRIEKTH